MSAIVLAQDLPFEVGALYNRRGDIHGRYKGQQQGGISTPADAPFIFIFTGDSGRQHGYPDHWEDEGDHGHVFHYYGEGQIGDMKLDAGGNLAIKNHVAKGKRLLVFRALGHGRPVRFVGEFILLGHYMVSNTPDTAGNLRNAVVFRLKPIEDAPSTAPSPAAGRYPAVELSETVARRVQTVRVKQSLFRLRLCDVEKHCRITRIMDTRFLRASHMKPWSHCATGEERTDGNNGLLLSAQADHLFDRGWITFQDSGHLEVAPELPKDVIEKMGLDLKAGRNCGKFEEAQIKFLNYHQSNVFRRAFNEMEDPLGDLLAGS